MEIPIGTGMYLSTYLQMFVSEYLGNFKIFSFFGYKN